VHEAPVGGKALTGDKFYFSGTIANNLPVEMTLNPRWRSLTGTYFYPKVGKNINLAGAKLIRTANVELKESDDSGKDTGVFKGKWKPATDFTGPHPERDRRQVVKARRLKGDRVPGFQQPITSPRPARYSQSHQRGKQSKALHGPMPSIHR